MTYAITQNLFRLEVVSILQARARRSWARTIPIWYKDLFDFCDSGSWSASTTTTSLSTRPRFWRRPTCRRRSCKLSRGSGNRSSSSSRLRKARKLRSILKTFCYLTGFTMGSFNLTGLTMSLSRTNFIHCHPVWPCLFTSCSMLPLVRLRLN